MNFTVLIRDMMPMQYIETAFREDVDRAVCDYIAGMSDNYAVAVYREQFHSERLE